MTNKNTAPAHTPGPWACTPLCYSGGAEEYQIANKAVGNNGVCVAVTPRAFNHEERKEYFANARLIAAAPDMRRSSQKLYDALQRYLDVSDCELPAELVEGMNELEAAWHKADGTVLEAN